MRNIYFIFILTFTFSIFHVNAQVKTYYGKTSSEKYSSRKIRIALNEDSTYKLTERMLLVGEADLTIYEEGGSYKIEDNVLFLYGDSRYKFKILAENKIMLIMFGVRETDANAFILELEQKE